jgi:hypothetical protein
MSFVMPSLQPTIGAFKAQKFLSGLVRNDASLKRTEEEITHQSVGISKYNYSDGRSKMPFANILEDINQTTMSNTH